MSVFQQEPITVDTVDIQYFIRDTDIVEKIPEGGDGEHSIHSRRSRMFSDIIIYMYNNTKRLATSERLFIRTNKFTPYNTHIRTHKFTPYNIPN